MRGNLFRCKLFYPHKPLLHARSSPTVGIRIRSIDRAGNYHKRIFLEAWYSQRDPNLGNDHVDIPDIYASLH